MFEKQAQLRPDYHWAWFNLGRTYLHQGDAKRALQEIQKNPPNHFRDVGLAMAYFSLRQETKSQAALQKMISDYGERQPKWVADVYSWRRLGADRSCPGTTQA